MFRKRNRVGWLPIEELSTRLQKEADDEYAQRQRNRPAAEMVAENERAKRLKELVMVAMLTGDPEIWKAVEKFVAGS
jgi:hypothetical protein